MLLSERSREHQMSRTSWFCGTPHECRQKLSYVYCTVQRMQARLPARSALLIDADNLGIRRADVPDMIEHALDIGGPFEHMFAAGNGRGAWGMLAALRSAGVNVKYAANTRNAADNLILAYAQRLALTGLQDFYVCTRDSDLAKMPGRLHLLMLDNAPVTPRLLSRASSVERLGPAPYTIKPAPLTSRLESQLRHLMQAAEANRSTGQASAHRQHRGESKRTG